MTARRGSMYVPSSATSSKTPSGFRPSISKSASIAEDEATAPIVWPPSSPISTRVRSSGTDDLREHAVQGLGVHECDLVAAEPGPRRRLDHVRAAPAELVHRLGHVVDLESDVVHAGPAA